MTPSLATNTNTDLTKPHQIKKGQLDWIFFMHYSHTLFIIVLFHQANVYTMSWAFAWTLN